MVGERLGGGEEPYTELLDPSAGCLGIVPQPDGGHSLWLVKYHIYTHCSPVAYEQQGLGDPHSFLVIVTSVRDFRQVALGPQQRLLRTELERRTTQARIAMNPSIVWNQHASPTAALLNMDELDIIGPGKRIEHSVHLFLSELGALSGATWPVYGDCDEVVFHYAPSRAHRHVHAFLSEYRGTLLSDARGGGRTPSGRR